MSKPRIEAETDGDELTITFRWRDIEGLDPDDVPEAAWEAFLAERDRYRDGLRAAWAYETARKQAYESTRGTFR